MAAAMEHHVQLAQRLHPRLLAFFKKFPPPQIAAAGPSPVPAAAQTQTISIAENTSSPDPNAAAPTIEAPLSQSPSSLLSSSSSSSISPPSPSDPAAAPPADATNKRFLNPFVPFKNPRTGNWHAPVFSLRRQAELYKLAAKHHVLPLMPLSRKHPEVKEQRRIELGLRVQGTGVGRRVKGKAWERSLQGRLRERQRAMEAMPEMIRLWKERGHGRGWKKWPK